MTLVQGSHPRYSVHNHFLPLRSELKFQLNATNLVQSIDEATQIFGTPSFHHPPFFERFRPHSTFLAFMDLTQRTDRAQDPNSVMHHNGGAQAYTSHGERANLFLNTYVQATFCLLCEFSGATHFSHISIDMIDGLISQCLTIPALNGSLHNSITTHFL